MTLSTRRLGGSELEPRALEVEQALPGASMLLWHLQKLEGLRVVARKSFPFTDDFEAYFIYKERLFVVETPFTNISVSLLGQPADDEVFAAVEAHIHEFSWLYTLLSPIGGLRYFFLPANPGRELLERYHPVSAHDQHQGTKVP